MLHRYEDTLQKAEHTLQPALLAASSRKIGTQRRKTAPLLTIRSLILALSQRNAK
jgi:hypothetical protein